MKKANVRLRGTITFVANVGEEGLGDLRGVKQLFRETLKDQIDNFISIDGTGVHVTNVAVGSHRYRVTFKGPGGHSFGAFGLANPMGAMGRAIAKIEEIQVAKQPKTTFNVGRVGGGTSVNSIPFEGWMEVDMRSSDPASLAAVDASFQKAVDAAVVEENQRWGGKATITVVKELVGDRPAGSTPENSTDRAERSGRGDGARLQRDARRGIHRFQHADEPEDSGDHHRRRRTRPRRARAHRVVRHDRRVDGHAARAAVGDFARAVEMRSGRARSHYECHYVAAIQVVRCGGRVRRRRACSAPRRRPISIRSPHQNVLLVTIDTLRADALGCYGGPAATPALDRLAR